MKEEKPKHPFDIYWTPDRVFKFIGVAAVLVMIFSLGALVATWMKENRSDPNPALQNPAQRY